MAITVPNIERIRKATDSTVADAFQQITTYVNTNITPKAGNRRAAPTNVTHPVKPT